MTRAEQYAWASLAAMASVYWFFQMRLLDGAEVADQAPARLLWTYFTVIALATIAEIIIAGALGAVHGKSVAKDERDHAIEARANQNERLFIIAAVNVVVWQALWENLIPDHVMPHIDLTQPAALFFWLFTILFAGEAVKRVTTLWLYAAQARA